MQILSINSGSSSLKYAIHDIGGGQEEPVESGSLQRIGTADSSFDVREFAGGGIGPPPVKASSRPVALPDHRSALETLARYLDERKGDRQIDCIGHRVVHGGSLYREPQLVNSELLAGLRRLIRLAPDHLPDEIAAIDFCRERYPATPQTVCFDTAFHRDMPVEARRLPLPGRFIEDGLMRYGFHGISCEYIMSRFSEPPESNSEQTSTKLSAAAPARIIIAHLGNGASMTAVRDRRSIDTTMGFTPAGGLVMSTRTGDLDPGVIFFLLREKEMEPEAAAALVSDGAGLLGVSEATGDMGELLKQEAENPLAAEAISLFCYQARKHLGALVFSLGGLDRLVFTGGIGERAGAIRERICSGLGFIGLELDRDANARNESTISRSGAAVTVNVIETDEELMIARHSARLMQRKEEVKNNG